MMVMEKACGKLPALFVDVMVPVKVPAVFGVPEITPAVLTESPPGSAPAVRL